MKETLSYLEEERRRFRRQVAVAVVLAVLGGVWMLWGQQLRWVLSGERNWAGEHVVRTRHASTLGEVDLRLVHEDLLSDWIVAMGQSGAREEAAWSKLSAAIATDANLSDLAAQWRELAAGDRVANAERLVAVSTAWSDYLDAQGAPWHIEGGVAVLGAGPFFYNKVYEVLADGQLGVDGAPRRVRLLRRADGLNVVEGWLGHTVSPEEGGLVVVDRILEFATDNVWPTLSEDALPLLDPLGMRFAAGVRAEAKAALPPEAFAVLAETAEVRAQMMLAAATANGRSGCSEFALRRVRWMGLAEDDRLMLRAVARADLDEGCPRLTLDEATALVEGSERLRRTRALDAAVSALAGWVARSTAAHEARHVADHDLDLDPVTGELSAYLASFATPGLSAVSLYQACQANEGRWGAHAQALAATGLGCDGVPDDLAARAAALADERLGWSGAVTLPPGFADALPLEE